MESRKIKYIDLGLPSGTLWADEDIDKFCDFERSQTLGQVPTIEQWLELGKCCEFHYVQNDILVVISKINRNTIKFKYRRHYNGIRFLEYKTCSNGLWNNLKVFKIVYSEQYGVIQYHNRLLDINTTIRLVK